MRHFIIESNDIVTDSIITFLLVDTKYKGDDKSLSLPLKMGSVLKKMTLISSEIDKTKTLV